MATGHRMEEPLAVGCTKEHACMVLSVTKAVDAALATAFTPAQQGHQPTTFETAVTKAVDAVLVTDRLHPLSAMQHHH